MLIEKSAPFVRVFRRSEAGFVLEEYEGLDAVIPLDEIKTSLPLSEI